MGPYTLSTMIVYACKDLIFATKIGSTAEVLGVPARPVRNRSMLQARLDRIDDGKVCEAVTGLMVDLELGEIGLELIGCAVEWRAEAGAVENSTVPRVIAFGPHVMTQTLDDAERRGADVVMTRGAFTRQLPELIRAAG